MKAHPLLLCFAAVIASAQTQYRVIDKIPIGGDGGWDYATMDTASRRLFVSHAEKVVVVDVDKRAVVGEIPATPGVHGIAIAPALNRGYTSNGRANTISIFDLKTLQVLATAATGMNPDAILYEERAKRVFAFNGRSKDATVLDTTTNRVLATIPLGGKPEFAVRDGKGMIYVNIEDTHEVVQIDASKPSVVKRYVLDGCEDPTGLAMDAAKRRLFSVCGNKVMIVSDPDRGKVIATVAIGEGSDGAGFDSTRGLAFSSNGEGTITVVSEAAGRYQVVETVPSQRGARTMAVDNQKQCIYLPTARFGPTPAPSPGQANPRAPMLPDSFELLVVGN